MEASVPGPAGWEDPLTGLDGPDLWQRILVAEVARAARYKRPLTVVLVDLDGLDGVAESWGLDAARHIVRETGQCLRRAARTSDYCVRLGTSRYGVVLTETDEITAINFVERVREAGPRAMPKGTDGMRLSFGWASPRPGESADAMVRRAEIRLLADMATVA